MGHLDRKRFTELVDGWYSSIYRMALSMLDDEQRACDVTQESFERLWKHRSKVDGKAAGAWLRKTALNLCVDILRRRKIEAVSEDGELELMDLRPGPLEQVVQSEKAYLLRKALNRLSEKSRVAVVLKDMEGLSYEEIAKLLEHPINTVKSDVFRGRRQLQKILKPYLEERR